MVDAFTFCLRNSYLTFFIHYVIVRIVIKGRSVAPFFTAFNNSNSHPGVCMSLPIRIVRFALVGALCFFVQWSLLRVLHQSMHIFYADVIAFLLSAQLNFVLSYAFTWQDRQYNEKLVYWRNFNISALVAVGINAGALWVLVERGTWQWLALIIAIVTSTVFTFTVNHFMVFRKDRDENSTELGVLCTSVQ